MYFFRFLESKRCFSFFSFSSFAAYIKVEYREMAERNFIFNSDKNRSFFWTAFLRLFLVLPMPRPGSFCSSERCFIRFFRSPTNGPRDSEKRLRKRCSPDETGASKRRNRGLELHGEGRADDGFNTVLWMFMGLRIMQL